MFALWERSPLLAFSLASGVWDTDAICALIGNIWLMAPAGSDAPNSTPPAAEQAASKTSVALGKVRIVKTSEQLFWFYCVNLEVDSKQLTNACR